MTETEAPKESTARWKPWGFWATAGLSLIVIVVYLLLSTLSLIPFALDIGAENITVETLEAMGSNPDVVIASTFVSATGGTLLILLIVALRKGVSWKEYLAIRRPGAKELLVWLGITLATMVVLEAIGLLLDRPAVPEWVADVYGASTMIPLLVLAIVFVAPLFEESFFRGFLFTGWSESKLGATGTIVLTALLFTVLHSQYDAYDLGQVFLLGVLLGIARHRSGSLVIPVVMHAFWNGLATIQVAYVLGG